MNTAIEVLTLALIVGGPIPLAAVVNRMEISLVKLTETMPTASKARRQFILVQDALAGLEEAAKREELKETGYAALNLLRAATDNPKDVLQ